MCGGLRVGNFAVVFQEGILASCFLLINIVGSVVTEIRESLSCDGVWWACVSWGLLVLLCNHALE